MVLAVLIQSPLIWEGSPHRPQLPLCLRKGGPTCERGHLTGGLCWDTLNACFCEFAGTPSRQEFLVSPRGSCPGRTRLPQLTVGFLTWGSVLQRASVSLEQALRLPRCWGLPAALRPRPPPPLPRALDLAVQPSHKVGWDPVCALVGRVCA